MSRIDPLKSPMLCVNGGPARCRFTCDDCRQVQQQNEADALLQSVGDVILEQGKEHRDRLSKLLSKLKEVKAFAEVKQKEARAEMHTAMNMQMQHGNAFGHAVSEAQRALRAYTSILEVMNGESPCDSIHKDDEE